MNQKTPKPKRCKSPECRQPFQPRNSMQAVCSPRCGLALAAIDRKRKEAQLALEDRRDTKERKEKLKTRADYAADAQKAFNAWIRERDAGQPCISCGTTSDVQFCAGHYRTVGACPELRYEPLNVHRQCNKNCNLEKSGNIVEYRIRLVQKIGAESVAWLEGAHEPKRYTIDDLKAITKEYRAKARELKRKLDE